MAENQVFAQVLELGRMLGWHDGSGRSQHQEYVNAYSRRRRRADDLADDEALIRHAAGLQHALFETTLTGGELATLVLDQQRDDTTQIRRPRHVLSLEEPAAILALRRKAA